MEDACTNPDILRIIAFILELLKIVYIAVPIGLIIMVSLDFAKNVMAGKTDDMDKNLKKAIKRILYSVCIFLVPTVVLFAINTLGDFNVPYATCISNSNIEKIDELTVDKAEELLASAKEKVTNLTKDDDSSQIAAIIDKASSEISYVKASKNKDNLETELKTVRSDYQNKLSAIAKEKASEEESTKTTNPSSSGSKSSTGSGNATGYLKSPVDPSDTNKKMLERMQDNSKTLYYKKGTYHGGSDVPLAKGTKVYAMDGGEVYKTGSSSTGYGTYIILKHEFTNKTYYTLYGHLSSIKISKGDSVSQGQLIGLSGNTGNSTGPHLHIELDTAVSKLGHTANCVHILTLDYIGKDKKYTDATGYCH